MPEIDWTGLPDKKETKIDFSGLPDKGREIDMSGLPDKPNAETILGSEPTGGTWWSAIKAGMKIPLAVVGGMLAFPYAGFAGLSELAVPRKDRLGRAERRIEQIAGIPSRLITTPEEAESMELIEKYGMWPIRKAGEGWRMIGKETRIPYAEPILATIGEAAAMGAIGGETVRAFRMKGRVAIKGLSAKNIEKLRVAQESKYGRYGTVPEEGLLMEGTPTKTIPIPQIPKGENQGLKVMDLIGKRRAEIDKGILDSEIFIKQFERDFTPTELEAVPFILEKGKKPIEEPKIVPAVKAKVEEVGKPFPTIDKIKGKPLHTITRQDWYDSFYELDLKEYGVSTAKKLQAVREKEGGINKWKTWSTPEHFDFHYKVVREAALRGEKISLDIIKDYISEDWAKDYILHKYPESHPELKEVEVILPEKAKEPPEIEVKAKIVKPKAKPTKPDFLTKIGREDLIPIVDKPSAKLLAATKKIGKYYDESFKFLQDNWGDVGFVEDYVTHIWDIPKGRRSEVVNYFATRNPFLKKRTIPTLEEGIKLGLKPKTTNITELLRIYDQYKIKTVHNLNFAKGLKDLVGVDGEPLMMRSDKAPVDWVTIDHPAMNRAMYIGKAGEKPILAKIPVKVHPEIAKEVKIIFDKPFSHGAIHALETINAFAKKGMLTLSLFHHHALTESAFSTGIGWKAVRQWNPYKIVKALRNKDYEVFRRQELAKDGIDHGLTFGALTDVQRHRVARTLMDLERIARDTSGARQLTKGMRKANELWDAALWDYYHNSLKLWAYEKNVFDALKFGKKKLGRDLLPNEITEIKKTMAGFVNDSFGGQNWELNRVLGNPKTRQMLHWALLAPDWTFSVLKQAAAPAKGIYKQIVARKAPNEMAYIQQKLAGKALTRQGAKFWAKAALYFNLIAQSVNYALTKKEYGEGRFTWDNPEGHYLNIFIGRNRDGTEKYMRMGKQFREVLEWGMNPVKKLGAKLSPGIREGIRQITAHDPGSGYPAEWAEKEGLVTLPERGLSLLEMPIPFSLRPYVKSRPGVFMFTFPTSRGMTNYKAVQLFKKALKGEDIDRLRKTYIDALQNKLHAEQLLKSAKFSVKADITYDNRKLAREILLELNELDSQAQQDALQLYKKKGILTPEIYKQYLILKNKQLGIKRQRLMFGIEQGQ